MGGNIKKKLIRAVSLAMCAALLCAGLCGCAEKGEKLYRFTDVYYDAFDTVISIIAYCGSQKDFDALSERVHSEFIRYHRLFDIYNEYDGLVNAATLNKAAEAGLAVSVPEELIEILEFGKQACEKTGGRVNIAMGAVLSLWHEAREFSTDHPDKAYVPSEEALKAASQHCNIDNIIIDRSASAVRLADPLMSIDLGAVAKGWAVEKIAQSLIADGTISGTRGMAISAGGNVRVLGPKDGGGSWTIAVQDPKDGAAADDYADTLLLEDISLVTSGVNQRYYEADGKRWHHIIDPDSLQPEGRYLSVTILTEDSGLADALSTALFNMSIEDGTALLEALKNKTQSIAGIQVKTAEALWILPDGSLQSTSGYVSYRKK